MKLAAQLRHAVAANRVVLGTFLVELKSSALPTILKSSGFGFYIIDTEHGAFSAPEVAALIAAGKSAGICPFVRVSGPDRGPITIALDAGAEGILIPMVRTLDDARRAVEAAKYTPVGRRGLHFLRPHTNFSMPKDLPDYCRQANANTILALQIETAEAAGLIDEIAATSGVDMLYLGPGDLSMAVGGDLGWANPAVRDITRRIAEACAKHGKLAAGHIGKVEELADMIRLGIRVVGYAAALRLLSSGAQAFVSDAERQLQTLGTTLAR